MDEALVARYPDLERTHFWWVARRSLVRLLFARVGQQNGRVLDVGCGSGMTAKEFMRSGAIVVGVDVEAQDPVSGGPENYQFVLGDYLEVGSGLGEFDLVVAMDSIEHFEDEGKIVKALWSNVRPGGTLFVTVPAYSWLWSSHDDENRHYRRYSRRSLRKALTNAGLEIDRLGYIFAALVLPKIAIRIAERMARRPIQLGDTADGPINSLASRYFAFELRAAEAMRNFFPFGTSVVAVSRKPQAWSPSDSSTPEDLAP